MEIKLTSGSLSGALGLLGTGMLSVLPVEYAPALGWLTVGAAAFVFLWDIRIEHGQLDIGTPRSLGWRLTRMWPQLMMLAGAFLLAFGVYFYMNQVRSPTISPQLEALRDRLIMVGPQLQIQTSANGDRITRARVVLNFRN